jgi:hypothetical protein
VARQVCHRHLGPQLVEAELGRELIGHRPRTIEQQAAAVAARGFGNQKVHDDLALRRQQGAKTRGSGPHLGKLGGHEIVEKVPRIVAIELDDATVGEKRCLHSLLLLPVSSAERKARG